VERHATRKQSATAFTDCCVVSFQTIIGIDYSGAGHCCAGLSGIRAFVVKSGKAPVLVGIDHAFSFPAEYFALHEIPLNWDLFLDHFCDRWPLQKKEHTVKDVLKALKSEFGTPHGNARWRRLAERMSKGAKSVFHFGVPGAVANSTHAGIPWLQYLRTHPDLIGRLHFWPFDGWIPKEGCSVIAEVYPSIWNKNWEKYLPSQDQHDAFVIVKALCAYNQLGQLSQLFDPEQWSRTRLSDYEKKLACVEGWILGLT
jgi:hypothetical protein